MLFRPVSTELVTPQTTFGVQGDPSITRLSNGMLVIVWDSNSGDSSGDAVMGRFFNPGTNRMGAEFRLNSTIQGTQADPVAVALTNGRFAAAWVSMDTGDGSGYCIRARVFEADGTPVGNDFIVNTATLDNQVEPTITALSGGGFAVAFTAAGGSGDGSSDGVRIRRFDGNGTAFGNDAIATTTITGPQGQPSLATLTDGSMVMIFGSSVDVVASTAPTMRSILFDAQGNQRSADFSLAVLDRGSQGFSSVLALADGGFFATWFTTDTADGSRGAVRGRLFDAHGTPRGPDFLLNTATTSDQVGPVSAQLDDGRIVVVWLSYDAGDRSGTCIRGRIFSSDGRPEDDDFVVNAIGSGHQIWPTITALPNSGFAVSWTSGDAGDGSFGTIRTRVFEAVGVTRFGTSGDDRLEGANFADTLDGSGGDDVLVGLGGRDILTGGEGNDDLDGGEGSDTLYGGNGDDRLNGGADDDVLVGNAGADVFVHSNGNDRISVFETAQGRDRIDLTALTSLVNFRDVLAISASISNFSTMITFSAGTTLELVGTQLASLQPYHFIFATAPGNDVLGMENQNDALVGTAASEALYGFSGNDELNGGLGNDVLSGGAGNDIIHFDAADTWVNVSGGTGFDTLVIAGGSVPTHLSLTAQGFEQARHEYADIANTQSWSTSVDLYNAQWRLLSSVRQLDDGGQTVITAGDAGDSFSQRVETFNAAAVRTLQQTYNADGSRIAYYWDVTSSATWRELSEDFNAAGERVLQRIYNDDGSYRFFYWDLANQQTWASFDEEFNAAGMRHTQRIYNDNGSYRFYFWDFAGTQNWATFDEEYTATGQRFVQRIQYDTGTSRTFYWDVTNGQPWTTFDEELNTSGARVVQRVTNDDGTSTQQFWDANNTQTYSSYVDYMNEAGQRIEQRVFHDQGADAGGYTRVFYDPTNAQPWQQRIDVYNAAGVLVSSTPTPD